MDEAGFGFIIWHMFHMDVIVKYRTKYCFFFSLFLLFFFFLFFTCEKMVMLLLISKRLECLCERKRFKYRKKQVTDARVGNTFQLVQDCQDTSHVITKFRLRRAMEYRCASEVSSTLAVWWESCLRHLRAVSEILHKLHWFCIVHDFKLFVLFFHRRADFFFF